MTQAMCPSKEAKEPFTVRVFIPLRTKQKKAVKPVINNAGAEGTAPTERAGASAQLVEAIARAFYWQRLLDSNQVKSGSEIAWREKLHPSTVNELLRLTLLDPTHVQDILEGAHPPDLSMLWFTRNPVSTLWEKQTLRSCVDCGQKRRHEESNAFPGGSHQI